MGTFFMVVVCRWKTFTLKWFNRAWNEFTLLLVLNWMSDDGYTHGKTWEYHYYLHCFMCVCRWWLVVQMENIQFDFIVDWNWIAYESTIRNILTIDITVCTQRVGKGDKRKLTCFEFKWSFDEVFRCELTSEKPFAVYIRNRRTVRRIQQENVGYWNDQWVLYIQIYGKSRSHW